MKAPQRDRSIALNRLLAEFDLRSGKLLRARRRALGSGTM
jgi:hypothetical protein